jgi:DNA-binding NtrC family response regulator
MKKVLVLTDDIKLLSTVAYHLEGNGYDIQVTQSAPQALLSLQTDTYHSLISDVDSDNAGGLELARIAAGLQRRIRVILVSSKKIDIALKKFPFLKAPIRAPRLLKMLRGGT